MPAPDHQIAAAPRVGYRLAVSRLRPAQELAAGRPHGIRLKYLAGCRCVECKRANTQYEIGRARARKAGDWNGIVPATRARAHIKNLRRAGVGRLSIEAVTDIPHSVVQAITTGAKQNIRARTERKILAVDLSMRADHAFVDAGPTWRLLNELIEEGYTKRFIAQQLDAGDHLQIRKTRVLVRTAAAVAKLHARLTA